MTVWAIDVKLPQLLFGATFGFNFGYFLFQHLVTLTFGFNFGYFLFQHLVTLKRTTIAEQFIAYCCSNEPSIIFPKTI